MKKSTKIILSLFIILFTISIIPKENTVQNDTFFDIAIGNYIMENGIDMMDHWTWHTELTYTYSHWLYSIIIALIYNFFSYVGIYLFVLIMACIITVTIFNLLIKKGHNAILSFIITLITTYFCKYAFVARAQILSYPLFIMEYYFIERLLSTNKKRYIPILVCISVIIANIHASLWILTIVLYLPYIVEFIVCKVLKKIKVYNENSKIIVEDHKIILLLIALVLSTIAGLLTPLGDVPYTFMYKNITGISSDYIQELQPMNIISTSGALIFISIAIGLIFTKTKYKFTDFIFFIGFLIMSLSTLRSQFYWFFIGAFITSNLLESFFENYKFDINRIERKFIKNKRLTIIGGFLILVISIHNYSVNISANYFDEFSYPIKICQYIIDNVDMENMKIFNQFNYGSYLEFCGIPAFMDSRSEVYCEEFNDTTILEDLINAESGKITYEDLFDKYEITHVLIYKSGAIYTYIQEDENYELLCEEDNYVLYLRKNV